MCYFVYRIYITLSSINFFLLFSKKIFISYSNEIEGTLIILKHILFIVKK